MASLRRRYGEIDAFESQVGKRYIPYIHLSWGSDAIATLEGHSKPVTILMRAAKDEHPNLKREKDPVQRSHQCSTGHGDESPEAKPALIVLNAMNVSAKAAPFLSPPSSLQNEKATASDQSSPG